MPETNLPVVLAGPILRRVETQRVTLWLATSCPVGLDVQFRQPMHSEQSYTSEHNSSFFICLKAGENLYLHLMDIELDTELVQDKWVNYDVMYQCEGSDWISISEWGADLCYPDLSLPRFRVSSRVQSLLHGSCRKPHYNSGDGLVRVDQYLQNCLQHNQAWPDLLMLSGDQVYVDDVAGPMLVAIHELIDQLKFPDEYLPASDVSSSQDLHTQSPHYYRRKEILPDVASEGEVLPTTLFTGARKPVFTSDNAQNHLISLSEVVAMYLLVWSPDVWNTLEINVPQGLTDDQIIAFKKELRCIGRFKQGLKSVRRVLAHLPTAMIFDDHDITDDWNLTAAWEQMAYGHPISKRIIGNALIGYWLCQGWGNAPENFPRSMVQHVGQTLLEPGGERHDAVIDELLKFSNWNYQWNTEPALIVLDTRTQRWRSEVSIEKPSGLMDWESITDLQNQLIGHRSVIMVSPAPVFGVKLIENIQRVFTWFGKPLLVDAENWMAHSGAATALMGLFRHSKTPQNFVILSGDVHYSFVYDVELRGQNRGPDIWQITSSGIKNEFPRKLLDVFDRLNRWLYAPSSPLNWFTKRRNMKIVPRKPDAAARGERLLNASGIGLVELDKAGRPIRICQLCTDGRDLEFDSLEQEAHWE